MQDAAQAPRPFAPPPAPSGAASAAERLFAGPGEMRARCRALDWSATPLGPVDAWPASLRAVAGLALATGFAAVVLWGPELVQLYNDAYVPFLGVKHPAALGMPTHACWPELRHVTEPTYAAVRRGETVTLVEQHYALRRRGPDAPADDVYITLTFAPVRDEAGAVGGVFVTLVDATAEAAARRAAEAARAAAEAAESRLRFALASARLGAWELDLTTGTMTTSAQCRANFGRPPAAGAPDDVPFDYADLLASIHPDDRPGMQAAVQGALARRADYAHEYRVTWPDGTEHWVSAHGRAQYDDEGRPVRMAGVTQEVTERRRAAEERERLLGAAEAARAEAEHANRAKSEFLAVMSHELRTPLNAIGGYAELLELGVRGPVTPAQRADLERIQKSQRHLLGLINGVLNYAKVDAGAVHYALEDVALDEVMPTCEALIAPQARRKGLTLRHDVRDRSLAVRADREKVQQVVLNLLSNAVKFTEPGGRVTLSAAAEGAEVAIRVTDTGRGIAPGQMERVFQPFVQVDAALTRTQEGTGLGLAISRDLARGMGGDLDVESVPDAGSTFTLTLPRA